MLKCQFIQPAVKIYLSQIICGTPAFFKFAIFWVPEKVFFSIFKMREDRFLVWKTFASEELAGFTQLSRINNE